MKTRAIASLVAVVASFGAMTITAGLPASATGTNGTLFPYASFWDVPRLGNEPVLGTGCGGDGKLGDQIPDGVWSGYALTTGGVTAIDLVCVIADGRGDGYVVEGEDNIINAAPLVVDNNDRVRYVAAPNARYAVGEVAADGSCVPRPAVDGDRIPYGAIAWIGITDGTVSWVFYNCTGFAPQMPELPPQDTPAAPPAEPTPDMNNAPNLPVADPPAGTEPNAWWPFPSFREVPQFGDEPVRGSGCGGSGTIGDTVPDGLWAAFAAYDGSNDVYQLDLVCIYYGTVDEVADDAVVLDATPGWVVVNNNTRLRTLGNDTRIAVLGYDAGDGVCRPDRAFYAPAPDATTTDGPWVFADPSVISWVRVADGNVTGLFVSC